jgi:hypothetical protein
MMLSTKERNEITMLGKSIREIYFCEVPELSLLEALLEESDKIRLHLPRDKVCGFIGEYSESGFSSNIFSANFETDLLTDSEYLYDYPNLINLTLTCANRDASSIDDSDLENMQLAMVNLTELQTVTFNLKNMQSFPTSQVKESIFFPDRNISVEYTSPNRKKRKR